MTKTVTTPWDSADHLKTDEDMAAYLEAALEEGNPALVAAALGDIARAKGMTQVAREAGLGRESLYKALSPAGNPEFATILNVVSALGLQLHAAPVLGSGLAIKHDGTSAECQLHRIRATLSNIEPCLSG